MAERSRPGAFAREPSRALHSRRDSPGRAGPRIEAIAASPPSGPVASRESPVVRVRAVDHQPGSVVVACTRTNGGLIRQQHIAPDRQSRSSPEQRYTAVLPHLLPGDQLDYRLELRRRGRCVASLPPDGTWLTLQASELVSTTADKGATVVASDRRESPRWGRDVTFFANLAVDLRADIIGPTPDGFQVKFSAEHGQLRGPRITADEVEGAEYVCVRPDGIGINTKHAIWRTRDGAIVLEDAYGITDLGPDGYTRIAEGPWTGSPPVTAAAMWATAHPDWQWLNRIQTMAIGRTVAATLHVEMDLYLLSVPDQ